VIRDLTFGYPTSNRPLLDTNKCCKLFGPEERDLFDYQIAVRPVAYLEVQRLGKLILDQLPKPSINITHNVLLERPIYSLPAAGKKYAKDGPEQPKPAAGGKQYSRDRQGADDSFARPATVLRRGLG
jgi:hypothetical protein